MVNVNQRSNIGKGMKSSRRIPELIFLLIAVLTHSCSQPQIDIYFLPFGDFSDAYVNELAQHYRQKYNLRVSVLPRAPLEDRTIDKNRHQLIAEELIETMKPKYQHLVTNSKAVIIGLTSNDIYIRQYTWRYAFTFRKDAKFAVVSCARMDPVNFGEESNDELLRSRLRKMITKNIGLLYYGLTQNNNPRSVLFGQIGGVEELDAVGEDF
jgi:predicted Zn-dependent protease